MELECRYTHDLDYNMALFRQVRRQNIWTYFFWVLFLVFTIVMSVVTFREKRGMNVATGIYIVFSLTAVGAMLLPSFQVRNAWKKNCAKWGREKFETVVTFGDSVRLNDDTGMEADIPWHKIAELKKAGTFLILRGEEKQKAKKRPRKVDYLYCPLSGFSDGTGQVLLDWMKEHHPKIPLTGWVSG